MWVTNVRNKTGEHGRGQKIDGRFDAHKMFRKTNVKFGTKQNSQKNLKSRWKKRKIS